MQFKNPEILWFLFLLLIPFIVHLFQLRRFKKTPFTNVAMLQKVVSESRKSSSLKKWLILTTRLLLLACLVVAFAEPFFAKSDALRERETVIYLDDSFSMQAKNSGIPLLEKAVQDLVKNIPEEAVFSLFTNNRTFTKVTLEQIRNTLLQWKPSDGHLQFDNMLLKAQGLFSNDQATLKDFIAISDFQNRMGVIEADSLPLRLHVVKMTPDEARNIAIDSIYLDDNGGNNQMELTVIASGMEDGESTPISLFNGSRLIGKTSIKKETDSEAKVILSLPKDETILGKLMIDDNSLEYDDFFYFTIDKKPLINVLSIGETSSFLRRIFTADEFVFSQTPLSSLNYSAIAKQNVIILDELPEIPSSLQTALQSFLQEGGSLIIIPHGNASLNSYNTFLGKSMGVQLNGLVTQEARVSKIVFDHSLYQGVFERRVNNFDYPTVNSYFTLAGNNTEVLSMSNDQPFLVANKNLFLFLSPLNPVNSSFQKSPLVVPTFYKMGLTGFKGAELFFMLGERNSIDLQTTLKKDNVIKLLKGKQEYIPIQQSFANKVNLTLDANLKEEGIFSVVNQNDTLSNVALNHKRDESLLRYKDLKDYNFAHLDSSIANVFERLSEDTTIETYWKWFVIFGIAFAIMELLLQKFLS